MVWTALAAVLALLFLIRGRSSEKSLDRLKKLHGESDEASERDDRKHIRRSWLALMEFPYRVLPEPVRWWLTRDLTGLAVYAARDPAAMAGMRVWATVCLPAAVMLFLRFSVVGAIFAVPLGVLGYMIPRIRAVRNRNRYFEAVRHGLPHTADMLYALVLGGKNLDQAFRGAAEAAPLPLGPLLLQAVREMELGASRNEAFARLLDRCPLPELTSLLRSLTEAERRGHPLSSTLEVFSREIRLRRRDQLKVAVAKAPLKMLAPLVFLILPASVMLTVGPTFLVTLKKVF